MSNYKYVKAIIAREESILTLCKIAGVKNPEAEMRLMSCYYMLGLL